MTLYEVLGITEAATQAEIKKAFRQLALDTHPDRHPGNPAKEARFKQITSAYETLNDPVARSRYDEALHRAQQEERLRAEEEQARRAQARSQQAPSAQQSPFAKARFMAQEPAPPEPEGGSLFGAIFAGLGLGLAAYAIHQASQGDTHWDPTVGRNRGPDGRFRSS